MLATAKNIIIILIFSLVLTQSVFAIDFDLEHDYPRLANYFLNWEVRSDEVADLARWDVLVLDMEIGESQSEKIKSIKRQNPDIVILAYITPQEIIEYASQSSSVARRKLVAGIKDDWYLQNSNGERLSWWPGTQLLNVYNSEYSDYVSDFVVDEILATGLWDGIFFDNSWDNISWFVGDDIDYNLDGQGDSNLDSKWQSGMKDIYNKTRQKSGGKYFILGNNETYNYTDELNGMMSENFDIDNWSDAMARYEYNQKNRLQPKINIINANTANSGRQSLSQMRFALVSTLLEDGYFSYDYGDNYHGQTWWYDEYDVNLGQAISDSVSKNNYDSYQADVWSRDFGNGIAVLNSTDKVQNIDLGGEYEKIHGTQDWEFNDGQIISSLELGAKDGIVMLKTFAVLQDVLFRNGDFVRFLDSEGDRVRNGFFVFEDGYQGGDKIAHIDLDGNGKRDLIVIRGSRIMAWRDDGQLYMKKYPFTTAYRGELQVAIADLNGDNLQEIYVAPESGYNLPIRVYTRHGRKMKRDKYVFGENYKNGYSLSTINFSNKKDSLLVGKGTGTASGVYVFDYYFNQVYGFQPFESSFFGGVSVAGGDVDGDGWDEIIVGAGPGKKPVIRIFDEQGQMLYGEITAYNSLGYPGIEVLSSDVDFDGSDDIIAMSGGI